MVNVVSTSNAPADTVRSYLREIGRVPLLTHEQEIIYGKQVNILVALQDLRSRLALQLDRSLRSLNGPVPQNWMLQP